MKMALSIAAIGIGFWPGLALPAAAAPTEWQKAKCQVYAQTWQRAQQTYKDMGISPSFAEENEAFIKGQCVIAMKVCPRTHIDIDIANIITVMTMNAGAASTFVPFHCEANP